jgi:uncharacterized protein YcbK (DUF882 family)
LAGDVPEIAVQGSSLSNGPPLALLTVVTLSPIVVLIGMRISATATLAPVADPWVPSSGIAASIAVQTLADSPISMVRKDATASDAAQVTLYNVNTRESETFVLPLDGVLSRADQKRITHLFRCKRTGHQRSPDPGLIKILAQIATRYEGHVVEVVSAHRHNRGTSRTSKHRTGHALDFRVQDVNVKDVRAFVWQLQEPIGLGYYRAQKFLHVDWRPVDGKIAWDQRNESSAYKYWPKWSGGDPHKKARKTAKAKGKKKRPSRAKALRSAQPQV